ncbi:MAG: hypothetical protein KF693_06365 [Nitrospira sp.]|nr:hypothetical protein [Nitrospira sp.]
MTILAFLIRAGLDAVDPSIMLERRRMPVIILQQTLANAAGVAHDRQRGSVVQRIDAKHEMVALRPTVWTSVVGETRFHSVGVLDRKSALLTAGGSGANST